MAQLKKIPVKERPKDEGMEPEGDFLSFSFPSFRVNEKQIPEIKNWKQGENYKIMIEVRMDEKSGGTEEPEPEPVHGSFDIVAYEVVSTKTINDELIKKDEKD